MTNCYECDKKCRKPPYTCSGKPEPDFLTAAQRRAHERAYRRGETNWSAPFEPWVVRTWAKRMDETGGFERADEMRERMRINIAIANDTSLTTKQKINKITNRTTHKRKS